MMVGAQIHRDEVPKSRAREDRQPLGALPNAVWGLVSWPLWAARLVAPPLRPGPTPSSCPGFGGGVRGEGQEWGSLQ